MKTESSAINLPDRLDIDQDVLAYLQTRMRCRAKYRRIPAREYDRLMEMDTAQVAHYLSESGYGEQARSQGLTETGANLIRAIVETYLQAEMGNVRRICRGSFAARAWMKAYAWKYDLVQLRFAVRARNAGMKPHSPVVLAALANLPASTYQNLIMTDAVDLNAPELAGLLQSPFARTLRHHFEEEACDPEVLEYSLLEDYFHGVLGSMLQRLDLNDPARLLLLGDVHMVNLVTVLSGRMSGVQAQQLMARLIPLDFWAKPSAVTEVLFEPELAGVFKGLQNMDKHGFFRKFPGIDKEGLTAGQLERIGRNVLLALARDVLRSDYLSPACMVAYVIMTEYEARNLTSLAQGKQANLAPGQIGELLVRTA